MQRMFESEPKYVRGDSVRLRHNPHIIGIISGKPSFHTTGWEYQVFFGSDDRRFVKESDLIALEESYTELGRLDDLLRNLLLVKLQQPLADNLYGLYASRTQFEVYQFKPAIKFLNNPNQRLLIADEVGLGKTIEAGIIFLELQARVNVSRVLIVCPSGLRAKWQAEMRSRFDETFTILDADGMRHFIEEYRRWGANTIRKAITSLELIRRQEFAQVLAEDKVHFDLVIIDEAHHCRNTNTLTNAVATILSDTSDAMLLLTATPLQLGNQDLFNLLRILEPGEFDDINAFNARLELNKHINQASRLLGIGQVNEALCELRKVEITADAKRFLNNPYYSEVITRLSQPSPSRQDMIAAQRRLLDMNTLAHIFTRTRKREVQENAPIRAAFTIKVEFTPQERGFYDRVVRLVHRRVALTAGRDWPSTWSVMMRERQAASCISAFREQIEHLQTGKSIEAPEDEDIPPETLLDDEDLPEDVSLTDSAPRLIRAADAIGHVDTKFDVFLRCIREILREDPTSKILVFSFFRGTLEYLKARLYQLGYGVRMIHGGIGVTDRQPIVEEFETDKGVNILLSSEVGSEGLDFQFCGILFNYDLPWNPMKVEQRIGRLDRFGQKHPRIRIYNLVIADTIEERIFVRLYERIGIFKQSLGDLEAILGEEIRSLSKRLFTAYLSPADEILLADQTAQNIIRHKQEMEEFETKRLQFMGQDAIFASRLDETIESGRFVSEAEQRALVESYIRTSFPRTFIQHDQEGDYTCVINPDQAFVTAMYQFVQVSMPRDQTAQEFLRRLRPGAELPITYSNSIAYERKLVEFVSLRHPVARAAVQFWKNQPSQTLPLASAVVKADPILCGNYYFFVFLFIAEGLESSSSLFPVVVDGLITGVSKQLSSQFLRLVQTAPLELQNGHAPIDAVDFTKAEEIAKSYAATERDHRESELARSNEALVAARLSAMEQTYLAKCRMINGYIQGAAEQRIRRMREAQLRNVEARYSAAILDVERQRKASISYKYVLAGTIRVVPPTD